MSTSRVLIVLLLCASPAVARPTPPWAVGVSEQNKQTAQRALDEGNALFLDKKYSEALAKYQAAVAAWDHPAIRFNIVRCLIQLDRQVEAADNLKLALKYGAAPLEDAVYNEALAYEKLLANQIGELSIECKQSGVVLTLDGQPLATCPAREVRRVSPGPHQVLGRKEGFLPRAIEVVVLGGKQQEVKLELDPGATRYEICTENFDNDGDGLVGCDDLDCWARCTPLCEPHVIIGDCRLDQPRCGDGVCAPERENCRNCTGLLVRARVRRLLLRHRRDGSDVSWRLHAAADAA